MAPLPPSEHVQLRRPPRGQVQDAFGWQDYHLWECRLPHPLDRVLAGSPNDDGDDWGRPTPDGRTVKLDTYFVGRWALEWCEYEYDFGDSWVHDIKLIGVHSIKESFKRRLLDGARACPPEDCGSVPGYEELVRFVQTGEYHDPDVDIAAWLGDWDPERFDLDAARPAFDRPRKRGKTD
ncbi:MAG: plasmid pRiA4b ORF-3 family protein [Myxococcota bacterium]